MDVPSTSSGEQESHLMSKGVEENGELCLRLQPNGCMLEKRSSEVSLHLFRDVCSNDSYGFV